MGKVERPKREIVGLELQALSYLCCHWARPYRRWKEPRRWKEMAWKLPILRAGVLAGQGGRERWERELVQDEMRVMEHVVAAVRTTFARPQRPGSEELSGKRIRFEFPLAEGRATIRRPMPVSPAQVVGPFMTLHDGRSSDTAIAKKIVSARLGLTTQKVRDALKLPRRRGTTTTPAQRLAASIFYDLWLSPPANADRLRWKILDALQQSEYPPICLYYLVQRAESLACVETPFTACGPTSIARLCNVLTDVQG